MLGLHKTVRAAPRRSHVQRQPGMSMARFKGPRWCDISLLTL